MIFGTRSFASVVAVDFEFRAIPGERPEPHCLVATDLETNRTTRMWATEMYRRRTAPYPTGPDALVVAYFATAELSCHLAFGWPLPTHVLDLYVEFRALTNGLRGGQQRNRLIDALAYFGLDALSAAEKDEMRQLAIRGGPFTATECAGLLDYCQSDVIALVKLLPRMLRHLDGDRALLRGRYIRAVARMEHAGVPIDVAELELLRKHWDPIRSRLVAQVDADFGVYDGLTFRQRRFVNWLARKGIAWPLLPGGAPALDDDTFREMALRHPVVQPLRTLRRSLSELKPNKLTVGRDGRNRCLLSPFGSRPGRNTPSSTAFIFGPPKWVRGLIRPQRGTAICYADYAQQEFAVAAALSKDEAMLAAYESGDPYLEFGKQAGLIPADGTKASHSAQRDLCKVTILATQYGGGPNLVAARINRSPGVGRELLDLHHRTYKRFWAWSDAVVGHAYLHGLLRTEFAWAVRLGRDANPRSFRNFPMQANGAEMMRLAACLATERGIRVVAPVHDAFLIEADVDRIEEAVAMTTQAMEDASAFVLGGLRLRTDVEIVRYPDRYMHPQGQAMWDLVHAAILEVVDRGDRGGQDELYLS
jgi:DNA polymerase-1